MNRYQGLALLGSLLALAAVPLGQAQDRAQAPAKEDVKALVQGNNAFALDLYRRLGAKGGNVVFSPYSISTALAMTYAGARGETAEQMAKVLHFSLPQERLHQAFGGLIGQLQGEMKGQPYQFLVANALWGQQGYPFGDKFLRLTEVNYRAGLREVDFGGRRLEAALSL